MYIAGKDLNQGNRSEEQGKKLNKKLQKPLPPVQEDTSSLLIQAKEPPDAGAPGGPKGDSRTPGVASPRAEE